MPETLIGYLAADRLGTALAFLAVAAVLAGFRHRGRLRPGKESTDA